jgi:hypothetical protein
MKMRPISFLTACLCAAVPLWADTPTTQPAAGVSTASTMPADGFLTEEQLVQAYRAHDFSTVIRETMRIQNVPLVASHYKLFDLAVLRSESHLQQKNIAAAIEGFTRAATLAPDDDRKSVMLATVMLLHEQRGLKYLSKTTDDQGVPLVGSNPLHKPVAIDVLDLSKRTIAFRALCCDKVAKVSQMLLGHFNNIPALTPIIALVQDVSAAERAADGKQIETKKLQLKTAEVAGLVINDALKKMTNRATNLQTHATDLVTPTNNNAINASPSSRYAGNYGGMRVPRGITSKEANELSNMILTAAQVPIVTKQLIEKLDLDAKYYDSVVEAAKTLSALAQSILDSAPINDNVF